MHWNVQPYYEMINANWRHLAEIKSESIWQIRAFFAAYVITESAEYQLFVTSSPSKRTPATELHDLCKTLIYLYDTFLISIWEMKSSFDAKANFYYYFWSIEKWEIDKRQLKFHCIFFEAAELNANKIQLNHHFLACKNQLKAFKIEPVTAVSVSCICNLIEWAAHDSLVQAMKYIYSMPETLKRHHDYHNICSIFNLRNQINSNRISTGGRNVWDGMSLTKMVTSSSDWSKSMISFGGFELGKLIFGFR